MKSRRTTLLKRWGWLLGVGLLVLGAAAWLGWVKSQRSVPNLLVEAARARGIELEPGSLVSSLFSTELRNSRFRLAGVPGVSGTVERLSVEHAGLIPKRVRAEGAELGYQGGLLGLAKPWFDWSRQQSTNPGGSLPVEYRDVRWTIGRKWGPPVRLSTVSSAPSPNGNLVKASRLSVASLAWQSVDIVVEPRTQGLDIGFGSTELKTAPARLLYFDTPRGEQATLSVQRGPCGETLDKVGLSLKHEGFRRMLILGSLNLMVPPDAAEIRGGLQFTIDNLPRPPLADSVVLFGTTCSLLMRFETDPGFTTWKVPHAVFTLPPYTLRGNGQIDAQSAGLRVRLDVSGALPCSALAEMVGDPVTRARIRNEPAPGSQTSPPELGAHLQIDLHTDRLDDTRVAWRIGSGCGLPVLAEDPELALSLPPYQPPKRRGEGH